LYPLGAMTVVHADLYRVRAAGELEALGLRDWRSAAICGLSSGPGGAGHPPAPDLSLPSAQRLPHRHRARPAPPSGSGG
jgi:tRNA A37 threonylcarbamoyladenosine biosynthesis protein TsaE